MNFTVSLLCCCCFVGAVFADIKLTNEQLDGYVQACLAKNKLSQGFFKSSDESLEYLTDEQKSCFLACMFSKAGIIKDDGSVNSVKDEVDASAEIKNCTTEAKGNICRLAGCLFKSGKFSIPIIVDHPQY